MTTSVSQAAPLAVDKAFVWGCSPAIQKLNAAVVEVARTNIPVLLAGENGTGKEVYGRLIHRLSNYCRSPIKKLSCRVPEPAEFNAQLKSHLGGHRDSSENGPLTLFLDGIDELEPACQKFLISLIPDGENDEISRNGVRFIASSSRNLEKDVESGRFRSELYFRINGFCLYLPSLRDRREDIPLFMDNFLAKRAAELGREVPVVSNKEMEFLMARDWPGNVRELENLARKIAVLGDAQKAIDDLRESKLAPTVLDEPPNVSLKLAARSASRQAERELIVKALERTHWNRKRAARDLQVSYKSLLYKIKQTGLETSKSRQMLKEG